MALVVAAAAAGAAAAGMYLDAKHAIRKDLGTSRIVRIVTKQYIEAVKRKRQSAYYFFEDAVRRCNGNDEAIWSREGCYTWAQTSALANQYAHWFLAQGVKPGEYVAFYLMNSPDFMLAWLGLIAIGAAPAMINYNLSGKALVHCLKLSGASIILAGNEDTLRENIREARERIEGELGMRIVVADEEVKAEVIGQSEERIEDSYREGVEADWPVTMFYTSGTTGMPKGVPFPTDRVFSGAAPRAAGYSLTQAHDRWFDSMPLYHGTGGISSLTNLITGVPICIGKKFSTSQFWRDIHDSRATWFVYVGETARYLLAAPPTPFDRDHNVRGMYGNGLRPDVWHKFRERFNVPEIAEFFSSSEGVFNLLNYCRGDYLATSVGHHGAILRFKNRDLYAPVLIDDASGAIKRDPKTGFAYREPFEKGGEIIVQIPSTKAFAGYYNNPEATSKKFERNVFKKGDLWYRSGDALRRTKDGRWFFLDRLGDTFRWKGENVSTAEVAEVLGNYPGVVEANVYGVALPAHDGRAGCAAVYIDPSMKSSFDFAGLLKHSRTHLPKYAVPAFIRIVAEMTPIHNNKQNKVPLRQEGVDPEKVKPGDKMLWVEEKGAGNTYVDFHLDHWEDLKSGRARL